MKRHEAEEKGKIMDRDQLQHKLITAPQTTELAIIRSQAAIPAEEDKRRRGGRRRSKRAGG